MTVQMSEIFSDVLGAFFRNLIQYIRGSLFSIFDCVLNLLQQVESNVLVIKMTRDFVEILRN